MRRGKLFEHFSPSISGIDSAIPLVTPTGEKIEIPLFELETLTSNVLFLFSFRGGVIVPIRASYADDLFGNSPQRSILEQPSAILMRERAYIGKAGNVTMLTSGVPILFYESKTGGGRGAVIAVGRVTRSDLMLKSEISNRASNKIVVDEVNMEKLAKSERRTVTQFDNIMNLKNIVRLERLREIGCADGANFVTAKKISGDHTATILIEGLSSE